MNIHVNVMAMPEREDFYESLAPRIGEHDVFWGERHRGVWWNAKRAWSTYPEGTTHICVLQEDIAVCEDFRATLETIVGEEPERIITLCALGKFAIKAARHGYHWLRLPPWRTFGVGNVMPVANAEAWLHWCERFIPDSEYPDSDDRRLGEWLVARKLPLYTVLPSPIQHIGHGRSLVGHDEFARNKITTGVFIGSTVSGLVVDWTDPLVYDTLRSEARRREDL